MEKELVRMNMLTIAVAGGLLLLTGVLLYVLRDLVSKNMRFFLPLPPIAVAAYIFVFNVLGHYGGSLPRNPWATVRELAYGTLVFAVAFCLFATANVLITTFFSDR